MTTSGDRLGFAVMGLQYATVLSRIPLFADLDPADLAGIASLAKTRRYGSKRIVVRQNEPGGDLFVILSGHAKVVASDPEGRDTALGLLGPGEVFGEVSLLDQAPRSATIITLRASEMLVLARDPFIEFLEQHPKCSIRLLSLLATRLRRLTTRAEDIAFLNVASRLAKRLLLLVEEYGDEDDEGTRLAVKLSQQEIGDLIGATRESANKQIRAWEQEGILSQRDGFLVVHAAAQLQRIASGQSPLSAPPPAPPPPAPPQR